MKVELKKVNEADGSYWYGVWVSGRCDTSHSTDLNAAIAQYNKIIEAQMNPLPPYEVIKSIEI